MCGHLPSGARVLEKILRCHFSAVRTKIAQARSWATTTKTDRKKKWGENKCKKERKLYSDGLLRSDEPINGASELPDR